MMKESASIGDAKKSSKQMKLLKWDVGLKVDDGDSYRKIMTVIRLEFGLD